MDFRGGIAGGLVVISHRPNIRRSNASGNQVPRLADHPLDYGIWYRIDNSHLVQSHRTSTPKDG